MTLSKKKFYTPLWRKVLCFIFGHRWFAIGYGTYRCNNCFVSASNTKFDLKMRNYHFDLDGLNEEKL